MKSARLIARYTDAFRGLPERAWWMALVVLVNRCGSMVFFFLPLYLTTQKGYSVAGAGRMISLWGLGSLAGSYLGGWLSDRFGTRAVQVSSLAASGAGFILLGFADGTAVLAASIFAAALLSETFRPANIAAFVEVCGVEGRTRGFTLLRLANNLGFAVGPALGGIFAARGCYGCLFWADGLTSLAAAAVLLRLSGGGRQPEASREAADGAGSPYRDGRLLVFLGLVFVVSLLFFQIFGVWTLYLKSVRGFDEGRIGLFMTVNALMIVFIEMPLMRRIERGDLLASIRSGTALVALGFALLPWMTTFGAVLLATMLWTSGEMMIFSPSSAWVAGRAPAGRTGTLMGLYSLTFSLALVVAPAAGTWSYSRLGPEAFWIAVGGTGFIASAGFFLLHRSSRTAAVRPTEQEPVEAGLAEV
jgi:predicted MFS family arabinose efflux permease